MASVNHKSHSRRRSASDPFTDQPSSRKAAPPPPPKSSHKSSRMPAQPAVVPKSAPTNRETHRDISEQPRDVVVSKQDGSSSRNRMGRSHTALTPTREANNRLAPVARRSQSQDSAPAPTNPADKSKSSGKPRPKKGSQHADVIDRLDYTGVGLFHHDGPFDACAPSRNRQRNKAPMLAWSGRPEDAAPELAANTGSPYPAPAAYNAFSTTNNYYQEPPKKKIDAIAEAWGIHEPEPFEEFFAGGGRNETPASSIHNGRESHSSRNKRIKDTSRDVDDAGRRANRRSAMPPPQPIFVPDAATDTEAPQGSPPATSAPKRSKSLMQRIRKMRDNPNVPVSANDYREDGSVPPSPTSPVLADSYPGAARPTHRSQNSFLGRFGGKAQQPANATGEPFVLVNNTNDASTQNKELPVTPYDSSPPVPSPSLTGYFDTTGVSSMPSSPHGPMSAGMARKPSLMKKMRGVMRPSKRE